MSRRTRSLPRMSIELELVRTLPADPTAVDAVGVGVFADRFEAGDVPEPLDPAFLDGQGFAGKPGQTCVVPGGDGGVVVAVGLGVEREATVATYRRAAAALARAAQRQQHVATDLLDGVPERLDRAAVAQALAEGVVLGAYRYTELKSDPEPSRIESLLVVGKGGKRVGGRPRAGTGDRRGGVPRPRPRQRAGRDAHADRLRGASRGAGRAARLQCRGPRPGRPSRTTSSAACWGSTAGPTRSPGS